ncbi:hypothetical protein P154DRAFT_263763 [Amniculicola lignicola CBS 123094]|uniref:Azaphilone pigments biosynthesis cluster protein L N-terminal domain-containing protein n=1 Tax=Amniculicola lignicola CBS 123094 TaxID=1392246 RepID=A0A6A5WKI4_9PLEO|nr:hypothetical protein P154DRAFT_263763 [Amniculicola lignicola CBS 123094]
MADPVSLIASIIAIATAAAQIGKAIARLRAFGEVPNQIFALKNEVADLEVVLRQVGAAIQQKSLVPDNERASLEQVLAGTKACLLDLAKALEKFASACAAPGSAIDRGRLRWKGKPRFEGYQEKIRGVKETLNLILGASNSHDLRHIKLELRHIAFLTSNSKQTEQKSVKMAADALAEHHLALRNRMDQQFLDMGGRLDALGQSLLNERRHSSENPPPYFEKAPNESASIETVQILLSRQPSCGGWCPCACHEKRKLKVRVPRMMESVVGKLFVGYAGLPIFNNPCDFRGCKDRRHASATVEYWFPWWFVTMNMKLQVKLVPMAGPQFQLSTTRRVPDSSQSITFAMQGNIEGLKYLFGAGLAGPRDVSDSRGYSLMRWALYGGMHNYETVHFLIGQGANIDEM